MSIDDFKGSNQNTQQPFNEASRVDTYQQLKERQASSTAMRQLEVRVTGLRAKARGHYAKNRDHWVNREINRISNQRHKPAGDTYQPGGWLGKFGPKATTLEAMRNSAEQHIENRQQQRMGRINGIYERMVRDIVKRSWKQDQERSR